MNGDLLIDVEVRRTDFAVGARLEVPSGSTMALLGPNGAGKSTLVGAVAGVVPIEAGTIRLGDRILEDTARAVHVPPEERRIGLMFQDHLLFPHLSVLENVAFPVRSQGLGRHEANKRAAAWLDRLGLADLADRRPDRLSGGQAQRVALARTIASAPQALLFDEPLAAFDVATRTETRRLITEHLDTFEGPRLIITHDPTEAFSMADAVTIMERGEIIQTGTPEQIRRHPRSGYAADLAGINFVRGTATDGVVTTENGSQIVTANTAVDGPVLVKIHPRAIAIHLDKPEGSPRNVWEATVVDMIEFDERVRVATDGPTAFTAEITIASGRRLGLRRGSAVWVAVKATEVAVEPE